MQTITREEVANYLFKVLAEEKHIDTTNLKQDTLLKELEIDSFGFLEVIFSIEHEYDISFPKNYEHIKTLGDVVGITYNLILNKDKAA